MTSRGRAPRIAIIGAGMGGIAMAVKLRKAGIDSFTMFESAAGVGGTWWHNTYPGAQIDSDGSLYSYSFKTYNWKRNFAWSHEIRGYLEEVVDDYDLLPRIRLGTAVASVTWDDDLQGYHLVTADDEKFDFEVVVSAVGFLSDPKYPVWPGLETFRGPRFHTSRWDHSVDLAGKRVAVVGSGSTATQVVPGIAPVAGRVYMFQREAGWMTRKGEREFTPDERRKFEKPLARRIRRWRLWAGVLRMYVGKEFHYIGSAKNLAREASARAFIDEVFVDRPDLRAAVTPNHAYGGKRQMYNDTFYPTLLRDNVELVTKEVVRVTPTGVVDSAGVEREIDVLVLSTGFKASDYLSTLEVTGPGGRKLSEVWADGPYAYLGVVVPGFPNFYMVYGPNANGAGNYMFVAEREAEYVTRNVQWMIRARLGAIDTKPEPVARYNRWLQGRMKGTAWLDAGTRNYYVHPSGKVVTNYPEGPILWSMLNRLRRFISVAYERYPVIPPVPAAADNAAH